MHSNKLRKLVKSKLDTICTSYYHDAIDNAMYPHVVFDFDYINLDDYYRSDYKLVIDVWAKNNQLQAENIADSICELLSVKNLPQEDFLPTFYREARRNLLDEDKDINHIQIEYSIQTYDNI